MRPRKTSPRRMMQLLREHKRRKRNQKRKKMSDIWKHSFDRSCDWEKHIKNVDS